MDCRAFKITCIKLYISELSDKRPQCIPHAMMMWNAFENGKYFPRVTNVLALKDHALETAMPILPMVAEALIPLVNMLHFVDNDLDNCDLKSTYYRYIIKNEQWNEIDGCSSSKYQKARTR